MEEALDTRVWLKCGGYLVIEPTEAMTVIDVNSGKMKRKSRRGHLLSGKSGGCRRSSKTVASAESVRYHYRGLHQYVGKGKSAEGLLEYLKNADHTGSSASPDRGYDATWSGGDHPKKIPSHPGRTIQEKKI